ncbi:hypothetical protein Tco_1346516 [Tanacetum coccineum]
MKYSEHKKGKGYRKTSIELPFDPNMFAFEDYSIFDISRDDEDDGAVADINNLDTTIQVSRNPTTRIHKDHPLDQVIGDMQSSFNKQEKFLRIERTWVFPDIMFADVVPVLDTKSNPKVSHLHDVKRIFSLDRKSTTEEAELWLASSCVIVLWIQNQLLDYRKPKRKDTQVPQPSDLTESVADEAVHKELCDSLVRDATTASSLEAEQDSGNINKTQSKATPNESSSLGTTLGGGPRCQETMGDTIAQTRFEHVSKHSNDSLLARGNTLQSDEDRLKLDEFMALCTTLQNMVLALEKTKTTQHNEIAIGLIARVESSDNEESLGEDASKQGRIDAIDADEEITLVSVQNMDEEMFDVNVLDGEELFVAEQEVVVKEVNDEVNVVEEVVEVISAAGNVVSTAGDATTVSTAITTIDDDGDITLAQALIEMKSTKPKKKRSVIQELGESTTTISSQLSSQQSQDKGKGILIEPVKPMKKKDLIRLDEEVALKLQAEFDEEERLAREKAEKEKEANIALIETWDDIQAKIDVDHQLAERLQAQEQEELSIEEKATLFQQILEKRRKHFAAKRAEEKRNKPPTKA